MVKIAKRDLGFSYFAPSGGRGCPARQPPPVARGRPACRGLGARWGRGRAPQPQMNSDAPAGLKSRRRPDGQSHLILNTRYGRPGGPYPNYDLMQYLALPCGCARRLQIQVVGDRREAAAPVYPIRCKKYARQGTNEWMQLAP